MSDSKRSLNVRLPVPLIRKVKIQAVVEEGRSICEIVEDAIVEYLNKKEEERE